MSITASVVLWGFFTPEFSALQANLSIQKTHTNHHPEQKSKNWYFVCSSKKEKHKSRCSVLGRIIKLKIPLLLSHFVARGYTKKAGALEINKPKKSLSQINFRQWVHFLFAKRNKIFTDKLLGSGSVLIIF